MARPFARLPVTLTGFWTRKSESSAPHRLKLDRNQFQEIPEGNSGCTRMRKDAQGCTRMHKGYFPGCQGIGVTRLWRLRAESSNLSCQDFREDVETTNQELRVHGEIGSFIASWAEVFIIIGQQFWGEFEICSKNQAASGVFLQRIGPCKQEFLILQGITRYIITFFRLVRPTDSWFSNGMIPCGPVLLFKIRMWNSSSWRLGSRILCLENLKDRGDRGTPARWAARWSLIVDNCLLQRMFFVLEISMTWFNIDTSWYSLFHDRYMMFFFVLFWGGSILTHTHRSLIDGGKWVYHCRLLESGESRSRHDLEPAHLLKTWFLLPKNIH